MPPPSFTMRILDEVAATGVAILCGAVLAAAAPCLAQPMKTVDLASETTGSGRLLRLYGSVGDGRFGVPVAVGGDCDGDGAVDFAMASMLAHVTLPGESERDRAGEVYLVFGDGTISGGIDTAPMQARVLKIAGDGDVEMTGSELWMDDVTGDGLADLLIARQNFTPDFGDGDVRPGAGALTILAGGAELAAHAATLSYLDLRSPPMGVSLTTLVGAATSDRLGIWMRTGDVDGDGIADVVVGADQESGTEGTHRGALYVVRGGSHLKGAGTIDLAEFGSTSLVGNLAKVLPPASANEYHFGATCQIADLDGDGHAEVMGAATLTRAGAAIPAPGGVAHATGGTTDGTLFIVWDDNFPAPPWPAGMTIAVDGPSTVRTVIDGGAKNKRFGEEILGGLDYDDDGHADLFVGDIVGDLSDAQNMIQAGAAHVLYHAASLQGLEFDLDSPPPGLVISSFKGAMAGEIAGDTAMHGDFNGDGIADLAFSSPHGFPLERGSAGLIHVFLGGRSPWPTLVDLAPGALPPADETRLVQIYGANGASEGDLGDTLCYSGAAGDVDGDGRDDIVTNEMLGNGLTPAAEDTGNLVVLSGTALCLPGDCNGNGGIDAGDPVCAVLCLIGEPPAGADCACAADCNCGSGVDAGDPICLVLRAIEAFSPDVCVLVDVCGDGVCDAFESCSICSDDCGACPGF